jgi:Holliday junction resolvasome RuvABC endonuclease subunit
VTAPAIIAFDLSLRATGVAHPDGGTHRITTKHTGPARLAELRNAILGCATIPWADLVVLEGLALRANGGGHAELAGLHYLVRVGFWEREQAYVVVSPATLKKYATGRGNAGKDEVLAAAIRRLGYEGTSHDEADALFLRHLALDGLGCAQVVMPELHRSALKKIPWPTLDPKGA